jgi:outer membrane lipoprotein-sorting protein
LCAGKYKRAIYDREGYNPRPTFHLEASVRTFSLLLLLLLATLTVSACASKNDNAPVQAVENYLNALVEKDANRLTTLSCGEWEEDALLELDSFQAVTARLEGLACEQTGTDGDTALVLCNGNIVATYNDEDEQLDLSVRTYQVVQEGGEWLVCGTR